MDFAKNVSFKSYGKIQLFCCAGTVDPGRLRVHSDLLDGTAFEALPLVVCTKGPIYKKGVETSLYPSTSWG